VIVAEVIVAGFPMTRLVGAEVAEEEVLAVAEAVEDIAVVEQEIEVIDLVEEKVVGTV